jgi:isochorismate synthase
MYDFIAYRIPEQKPVKKVGKFKTFKDSDKGFVISSFDQSKTYTFESNELYFEREFIPHFLSDEPHCISKETYLNFGNELLELLNTSHVHKVVLSRIKKTNFNDKRITELFDKLCDSYPKAFVYLVSSPLLGTWIGATPETLISSDGIHGFSMALAGTKDKTAKQPWKEKEYNEQQWVSDFILETLQLGGQKQIKQQGPYETDAGNLNHLRTDFSFDLGGDKPINIAKRLHPTPAVAGIPRKQSLELITKMEEINGGYSRDLYSGYIGIIEESNTQIYVNLRCAQFFDNSAYLYVGGGYTKYSLPENEWNETERKSETLLKVFEML